MTVTKRQLEFQHRILHIQFEQGRGKGGVPKVTIHVYDKEDVERIIKKAVALLRIESENAHGKDLMPEGEYFLHRLEGAQIEEYKEIEWIQREDGHWIGSVVLTWGLPSEHLLATVQTKGESS